MLLSALTKALAQGKNVRWSNDGYKVHWDGDVINITYESNGFTGALHASELEQCYVNNKETV